MGKSGHLPRKAHLLLSSIRPAFKRNIFDAHPRIWKEAFPDRLKIASPEKSMDGLFHDLFQYLFTAKSFAASKRLPPRKITRNPSLSDLQDCRSFLGAPDSTIACEVRFPLTHWPDLLCVAVLSLRPS